MTREHHRHYVHRLARAAGRHVGRKVRQWYDSRKHHHQLEHSHSVKKVKQEAQHGNNNHSGVENWSAKVMINKLKHKSVEFKQGRITYQEITSGISGSPAGVQGCSQLDSIGTVSQWMISTGTGTNYYATNTGETAYFMLNPNGNVAGPLIAVTNRVPTDRFFLSSVNWKASVTNFESIASTCWIYVCRATCNHNVDPGAALALASIQEGLGIANFTSPAPGANTGGSFGAPTIVLPGYTPKNNKNFNKFWSIKKCHRIDLAAGATEDVSFHIRMNQMGSIARFVDINPAFSTSSASWTAANLTVNYPAGSCALFIITKGSPVRDITAAGTNFPTIGSASFGVIIDKIHHFYPVKDQAARVDFSSAYTQLPANAALTAQETINEVDAKQPVIQA